jgi:2-polyprenyl-6-methoxyphenol hydroxylase-like FAD-dependent oxidoreductase
MTQRSRKAIIIGAGIAGPVSAIFLKRAGIDAQVFEAWPHSTGIGGGLQIAPNGMHVLAEIGLADEMIRRGSVAEAFEFYSQSGAKLGSINRNMQQRFGQPAVNMCRATLLEAILATARRENVEVTFEKRLVHIEDRPDQPVIAHFADGTSAEGDFLIGADGVHSAARGHVIPDGPKPFDTGLIGFGGFVPRSLLDHTAIGRRIDAATYRAMGQDAMKRHLLDFHAGWHDPIPQLLQAAENIVVTATLDVATLPTWSRKRTLLIGDAAHATSPHAGQGASLALEDAMRLGRLMQPGQEPGVTFENFESERRPRAERVVALARRNGNSKREFSATGAWIRDRMLKLLIPLTSKGMDWMYAYDPRGATPPLETSDRRDRQAA